MGSANSRRLILKDEVHDDLTVGIGLAKNIFALHGVKELGKAELVRLAVPREQLKAAMAALPPCLVGLEGCPGAHHCACEFQARAYTERLIAQVRHPLTHMSGTRGKNEAADAAAICETVQRPHLRFVLTKSLEQHSRLKMHFARQRLIEQHTATLHHIRGLLSGFGNLLPLKTAPVR